MAAKLLEPIPPGNRLEALKRDRVLPRNYQIFNGTLLKELLEKIPEIPVSLDYDAFGRIYEYFLGQFARTEGQKVGEFYTPAHPSCT